MTLINSTMVTNKNLCKIYQSILNLTFLLSEFIDTELITFIGTVFVTFVNALSVTFLISSKQICGLSA